MTAPEQPGAGREGLREALADICAVGSVRGEAVASVHAILARFAAALIAERDAALVKLDRIEDTHAPLSDDGRSVWRDGSGFVPLDFSQGQALAAQQARADRAEGLIDQLDDAALTVIHGAKSYSGGSAAWRDGASHGAAHVACDVRRIIRNGDPDLDARAIRRAALEPQPTPRPSEVSMSSSSERIAAVIARVEETVIVGRRVDLAGDCGRINLGLTTPEWECVLAALRSPAPIDPASPSGGDGGAEANSSVTEFLDAVSRDDRDEALGSRPPLEPDWTELVGQEIERHPLGDHLRKAALPLPKDQAPRQGEKA